MRPRSNAPLVLAAALLAAPALAETPSAFCKRVGTHDSPQPIPEALVPAVNAAFGTQLPARTAVDTTVFRCVAGHVMACITGANLPCGKANTDRTPAPGIVQWCHDNPNTGVVPAVATGHDTIYAWRCLSSTPLISRQVLHVDPRGFVAEFWKRLP